MRRVVEAAWDDAAALGFRYGHALPASLVARGRELIERAQRPRLARRGFASEQLTLRYEGNDSYASADLAHRFGVSQSMLSTCADLSFTEIARRSTDRWSGHLIAPQLVAASVDLRVPEDELWDRHRRQHAKRIERELRCELQGGERFDHFYDRMYAPTARARPGGYVARRRYLSRLASRGLLVFVHEDGRAIAGCLLVPVRGRRYAYDLRAWGALDGDRDEAREALAFEALFVFAIRTTRSRGAARLGLGLGYPFTTDGALRFKKRWGASVHRERHDPRCVAVRAQSDEGVRALASAGLIFEAHGTLHALGDDENVARTTPGVGRVHVVRTTEDLDAVIRGASR